MTMSKFTIPVNEFLHIEECEDKIILSLHKVKSEMKELYEFQIKTLREDFEQEREDRRRAHEKIETLRDEVKILRSQLRKAMKKEESNRRLPSALVEE